MRKYLLPVIIIMILSILLVGCGKEEQTEEVIEEVVSETPVEKQTLTLHMQMWDEEETPCDADKITLHTQNGKKYSAQVTNGEFVIEGLPYEPQMKCVLNNGTSIIAEFTISFWTGFELDHHNNLNTLSIDIPGNTSDVFLKAIVRNDTAKVTCEFVSQFSFDSEQATEAEEHELTEEEAVAAGLYGIKYASTTGLNLREEPTSESESVKKLNFGDALSLMNNGEEIDGVIWYKAQLDAQTVGYVSGEYLGKKYVVNKHGVNLRSQPTADSEAVYMLSEGAVVIAMDDGTKDGEYKWFNICTRDGLNGYIRNDFLTLS